MKKDKLAIVILNYNGKNLTYNCLKSLEKVRAPKEFEIETIVVDNNSKDGSIPYLEEKFPNVTFLKNSENSGYTGGNNFGINYAIENNASSILILNNDTLLDLHFLENLTDCLQRNPKAGIINPKIYFAAGHEFHIDKYQKSELGKVIWAAGGGMDWNNVFGITRGVDEVDKGQYDQEEEIDMATGCCMLIKAELLEKIQGFDNRYFMYYEDSDLCMKAKLLGYELWYCPDSAIWHINAGSSSSGSPLQDYFISRNRLIFGIKYAPFRTKFALIRESLRLLFTGRPWQKKGIIDFYIGKYYKGSLETKP